MISLSHIKKSQLDNEGSDRRSDKQLRPNKTRPDLTMDLLSPKLLVRSMQQTSERERERDKIERANEALDIMKRV